MPLKTLLTASAAVYACLMTQLIAAETLTVVITNVPESKGTIMLQVLAGEAEFKGDAAPIASVMQRATAGEMSFTTTSLPAGEYAVRIMHDLNENGDLDANFVGMPTEPWAFSNNAVGNFGPPKWDDVKFQLEGSVTQSLNLNR